MCLPIRLSSQDHLYTAFVFMKDKTRSRWISGVPTWGLLPQSPRCQHGRKFLERHCILLDNLQNHHMEVTPNCRYLYPDNKALESPTTCHSHFFFPLKTQIEIEHHGQGSKYFLGKKDYPVFFQFGTKQNTQIFHLIVLLKIVPVVAVHYNYAPCSLFWCKSLKFWSDLFMVTF